KVARCTRRISITSICMTKRSAGWKWDTPRRWPGCCLLSSSCSRCLSSEARPCGYITKARCADDPCDGFAECLIGKCAGQSSAPAGTDHPANHYLHATDRRFPRVHASTHRHGQHVAQVIHRDQYVPTVVFPKNAGPLELSGSLEL